jgi:hypothetical protein
VTIDLELMHQCVSKAAGGRTGLLLSQLFHHAGTMQPLDVTFSDREPILEVTLSELWAHKFCAAVFDRSAQRMSALLNQIVFSDGTATGFGEIWTLNAMPPNLDTAGVDLARGEEVIGLDGETLRQVVRDTYRCKSHAEEDFFLARWIAS